MPKDIESLAGADATDFGAVVRSYATANRNRTETALDTAITTGFPFDATIPQITEGEEVFSLTLTPSSVTSRVRVRSIIKFSATASSTWAVIALFVNGGANAVDVSASFMATNGGGGTLPLEYEYVPGVTTAQTLSIRAGTAGTGSYTINAAGGQTLGGVIKSFLSAEEIRV